MSSTPRRVLFVTDDAYPGLGGQAIATEGWVEGLVQRGHHVEVVASTVPNPTEPAGVLVHRLPYWQPGNAMARVVLPDTVVLAAAIAKADVVQAMMPTPVAHRAFAIAKRLGKPRVFGMNWQREGILSHTPVVFRGVVRRFLDAYVKRLFANTNVATAPTQFAKALYAEMSDGPCRVISCGIDLQRFNNQVTAQQRQTWRASLGLQETDKLVLSVARLSPEKDPATLVRLMQALGDQAGNVVLALGGTGPLRANLEQDIARLGLQDRVRLLGFVPDADLPLAYASSDVVAIASTTELQCLALYEAMAMGTPLFVAKYDTSAATEALAGGQTGDWFDPNNLPEAAQKLARLLSDAPALARMKNAALTLAAKHDIRQSIVLLEGLYEDVLDNKDL